MDSLSQVPALALKDIAVLGALIIVGLLLRHYLPGYFTRKGEYRAMREEIASITRLEQATRAEFSERLETLRSDLTRIVETLKADLSKSVYVHRVQVELEVGAYREAWDRLTELAAVIEPLREGIFGWHTADPTDSSEDEKAKLRRADAAYLAFTTTFERLKPFYPLTVYERLEVVRVAVRAEPLHRAGSRGIEKGAGYYLRGEELRHETSAAINAACEAIRTRLAALTSVGEPQTTDTTARTPPG
jgi:hypothetical protein